MPRADVDAAQKQHVEKLTTTLAAEKSKSTFACGGKIGIVSDQSEPTKEVQTSAEDKSLDQSPISAPITIRFGPDGEGRTLLSPPTTDDGPFLKLLAACDPASFGIGGKEVHDEAYRKATKLDPADFCTDFCPYTSGIVNIVNQLLVPSIQEQGSVKAELYKLNVYSGPSGKFKAHVDTPRSDTQVGSLVVALPSVFEGGSLSVRNDGTNIVFDWAKHSGTSIQWAAFYSDCEHEVHEVTAGHRITLTYNLYLTARVDLQADSKLSLDAASLPLAKLLKAALSEPRFMYQGGKIGIYLVHRYPHTHKTLSKFLPRCLKGVDMAVFEAARALGLQRSLICTTKESTSGYYCADMGYEDEYGEAHGAFGMYFPALKTLSVSEEMVGDDYYGELDGARPMYEGQFVWLNQATYKELSSAYLAYGNEPALGTQYTRAALLISVPKAEERRMAGHFSNEAFYDAMEDYEHWGDTEPEPEDEDEEDEDGNDDGADEDSDATVAETEKTTPA